MNHRAKRTGFTLLELVLVMVVICIVLAMAAPSLRGWSIASRTRDAGDQFLATTRWARTQAISNSSVHRLVVDAAAGKYWVMVQEGDRFETVVSPSYAVPEGSRIVVTTLNSQPVEFIDFFPNGRTQPARVQIVGENETVVIEAPSAAEGFHLVTEQEPPR